MTLLDYRGITHSFTGISGDVTAVDGIDLKIEEGEFVCLLGPSGCGKTTLLNMAAGFLVPEIGGVFYRNEKVAGPGRERAVVFQDSTLMPWLSVEENILLACPHLKEKVDVGDGKSLADCRIEEALETVGLRGFNDARPHELSGGMRQKVSIARCLVMDSPIMLMDEPFSSLDEQTKGRLNRELVEIWKLRKKTILFITHSISEALIMGTRIVLMSKRPGRIIKQWSPDRSFLTPDSVEFYRLAEEIRDTMELCCPPGETERGGCCCV